MSGTPRSAANWVEIEKAYRAGIRSLRNIAEEHGITETAIRKKAKTQEWTRDLGERIKAKAEDELVRSEVRAEVRKATEKEVVEQAAATVVTVVRQHRKSLQRGHAIVEMLFGQLREAAENRKELEAAVEEETAGDKTTERRNRMLRAISIPAHAGTIRDLSTALRNLIPLERQAFNIDRAPEKSPLQDLADSIAASTTNRLTP